MTLQEFVPDIDYFKDTELFYEKIAEKIGIDKLGRLLPEQDKNVLKEKFEADPNFNNIPIAKWDYAAGYTEHKNGQITRYDYAPLHVLMRKNHIDGIALSQAVCILKAAAKLIATQ